MRTGMMEELKRLWHEGVIAVPTDEGYISAQYWVKAYDEGSEYGINEGRISKLEIRIGGKAVAGYDRGWWKEPDETDEATMIAYRILLKEYN